MKNIRYILPLLAGLLAACTQEEHPTAQNVLYNGIELPDVWPPRYEEPSEAALMPVPYLEKKPEVIRVDLGRQLFVDDFLVRESDMETVFHKPHYYAGNPVLEPTAAWENTIEGAPYASPFSDGVWYDELEGKFKMWYLAGAGTIHKQDKQTFYTAYAESEDGRTWHKPTFDILPGTNVVDTCNRDAATIWLDRTEKDPAKRYKLFNVERRPTDRRWQFILKYSPDGIRWSEGVAQSGDLYDRSSVFYNPFRKVWCLSMRYSTPVSSRSRAYLEAADPEVAVSMAHRVRKGTPDRNVVFWFTPDNLEPRHPEFPEVDPVLGPEMRSTGEVLGLADTFGLAYYKSQEAAGLPLPTKPGRVLVSLSEKTADAATAAKNLTDLGFEIVGTEGTVKFLWEKGVAATMVAKIGQGRPDVLDIIKNRQVCLILNTPSGRRDARADDSSIRRAAIKYRVPYLTTVAAALAASEGIKAAREGKGEVRSLQSYHAAITKEA